jgi:transcriptional regulator with XRE-family HTH domain
MMSDLTFGKQVRYLREVCGLSQRDLAEQAEIDFTYLSKIENDKVHPPSKKVIKRLSITLGCGENVLLDRLPRPPEVNALMASFGAARADSERIADVLRRMKEKCGDVTLLAEAAHVLAMHDRTGWAE